MNAGELILELEKYPPDQGVSFGIEGQVNHTGKHMIDHVIECACPKNKNVLISLRSHFVNVIYDGCYHGYECEHKRVIYECRHEPLNEDTSIA